MADRRVYVTLMPRVLVEHAWIARDGRAWSFALVEVSGAGLPPAFRVAALVNEDDVE